VRHVHNEFDNGSRYIDGIESFCGYAKRRLVKFNEVSKKTFLLHLKETRFRCNYRSENLPEVWLATLRK